VTVEESFEKFWLEKFGEPDKQALVTSTVGQLYGLVLEAFKAGRESTEPFINPEWADEIVILNRSNSNFWTVSELARLFLLPEDKVKEILGANQDATGQRNLRSNCSG
jgi:hypothetical protein